MLHFLYSTLFRLILPFVLIRLWWHGRRSPDTMDHWRERLGYIARQPQPVIWVHAVSVGETIAAAPLVRELQRRRPDVRILMTAMTGTGRARAQAMFGDSVDYAFSPYDTPGSVRRFLMRARPRALVIMETEIWPNMIERTSAAGTPIFLINARMSARSAKGYLRLHKASRDLLRHLDWIAAQAASDARRFEDIGALPSAVSVTGSIKFDVDISPDLRRRAGELRREMGDARPVWIAASTHEGEDSQILDAHQRVLDTFPDALLVLVPRHPERFDDVAELINRKKLSCYRRSAGQVGADCQVYLGDTMGELLMLYGAADLAFVGGSLIERGGHNPLEPAAWETGVVSGPHVFNFSDIYDRLRKGEALKTVDDSGSLADVVLECLGSESAGKTLGNNALAVVNANRGALNKVVEGILEKLK
ncbi:lipid IV(A) 3-deoxy-D-manno-octulosonic acid transferase [Marinobacter sp. BGYM27]|uniref:lipid IV(A) 3-deoxy-D-manno-octulosonic acid transferase n=1 Tax=Marinobacter sp. BGYM27 TaxID=2975597 RepID=UPI0021A64C51|nr:lipid IV(A) 3-deoxy-D-manno-octulosonic acid transferase [Marinobacter sp. BGYM27]MDG5501343.1 lipid IV(A) 3-deoxy-D-manno-octulosonic acid transferase [Marinobacter sp. BGYM27]